MSNLPISSPYRSTPDAPVSEAERNQLSARLNDAFTNGTIDSDDYQARLDRLFAAQKMGDLLPVVEGLPPLQTYASPAIVAAAQGGEPGQLTQARSGGRLAVVSLGVLAGVVILIVVLLLILL